MFRLHDRAELICGLDVCSEGSTFSRSRLTEFGRPQYHVESTLDDGDVGGPQSWRSRRFGVIHKFWQWCDIATRDTYLFNYSPTLQNSWRMEFECNKLLIVVTI